MDRERIERTHRMAMATRPTELDSWLNAYRDDVGDLLAALTAAEAERAWAKVGMAEARARFNDAEAENARLRDERLRAVSGLPPDLVRLMLDPTITVPRDHQVRLADGRTLFEHLEEWRNAPSDTASASRPGEGAA